MRAGRNVWIVAVVLLVGSCSWFRSEPPKEEEARAEGPIALSLTQRGATIAIEEGRAQLASAPFVLEVTLSEAFVGRELGVVAVRDAPVVPRQLEAMTPRTLTVEGTRAARPQPDEGGGLVVSEQALDLFPSFAGSRFRARWGVVFRPEVLDGLAAFQLTDAKVAQPTVLMSSRQHTFAPVPGEPRRWRLEVERLTSADPKVRLGESVEVTLLVVAARPARGAPQGEGQARVVELAWAPLRLELK